MNNSPAFGQADLTNCERELIHLAGSIQPHGALLVVDPSSMRIVQASANAADLLGAHAASPLGLEVGRLGAAFARELRGAVDTLAPEETRPLRLQVEGAARAQFEGILHRHPEQGLIVELEPLELRPGAPETVDFDTPRLVGAVTEAIGRFGAAPNQGVLLDAVVQIFRDLTGYDRVMAYKFDPDGHGRIVAEARHPRLDSLLGHHYPASDIPQRARELYLRTRVRVLVDVHYEPVPILPRLQPSGSELDMSLCHLRSMSPLHIQYLRNMGVTATLVVSLVREGQLWGLIACHHYSPRNLRYPVRAACELLAEGISTRLAALENYAHTQVDILVRRLEQRLVEATSTDGDWRLALFRNARTLLQPVEATGAALYYDGEILTGGEVPSTPELRALVDWFDPRTEDSLFQCNSVARENPALSSLTPVASGVLAVRLSDQRPDYLVWFRKEQLQTVTWAGDPSKPVVQDDPLTLSPRRSFAAWSEIVRGTAQPWTKKERMFARAIGAALVDIVAQVHAVRLLIAEHQIEQVRGAISSSREPVLVAGVAGTPCFANPSFCALVGRDAASIARCVQDGFGCVAQIFADPEAAAARLDRLRARFEPWRGESLVLRPDGSRVPVSVRAEMVPGRNGRLLGFILILIDRTDKRRAAAALLQLEQSLSRAAISPAVGPQAAATDPLVGALLANASMAAMDISDAAADSSVTPMIEELEDSIRRANALYARIRALGPPAGDA